MVKITKKSSKPKF